MDDNTNFDQNSLGFERQIEKIMKEMKMRIQILIEENEKNNQKILSMELKSKKDSAKMIQLKMDCAKYLQQANLISSELFLLKKKHGLAN